MKKVAFITGGGGYIGSQTAVTLAKAGHAIAVCDINADAINRTIERIREIGGEARGYTFDITDSRDVDRTVDDIVRIAETESHRIANTSALDTARHGGATKKTWVTMLDDRVRETHDYLEGMTVGIDDDFYTYDGDHAPAPSLFQLASNNVNCRCELIFS